MEEDKFFRTLIIDGEEKKIPVDGWLVLPHKEPTEAYKEIMKNERRKFNALVELLGNKVEEDDQE